MKILFFCPRWGATDPWETFCSRVKEAGYDGVEASFPLHDEAVKEEALQALSRHNLFLIGQYWQSLEAEFQQHFLSYQAYLKFLQSFHPLRINCQTGKDYFTFVQNQQLVDWAQEFSAANNTPVSHETHRNKMAFAAHVTKQFLQQLPAIRLTLDMSHWCAVHESFLDDQHEALELACRHADHIHARIGYPEGPQINCFGAPEWEEATQKHLLWWDKIVERKRQDGADYLAITPEFGPAPYMPALPLSQMPVADQWQTNVRVMQFLKNRYEASH